MSEKSYNFYQEKMSQKKSQFLLGKMSQKRSQFGFASDIFGINEPIGEDF